MLQKRPTPVYIFTGFLDAGKTKFTNDSLQNADFTAGKNTLVIVCEEGEEEYDPSMFSGENIFMAKIENEEDISPALLESLAEGRDIDQVLVEYNGMWDLGAFFEAMPAEWTVYQLMFFADATTILNYNANMRSLMVDLMVTNKRCYILLEYLVPQVLLHHQ